MSKSTIRIALAVTACLSVALLGRAQPPGDRHSQMSADAEQSVSRAREQLNQAMASGDKETVARLLADDFVRYSYDGKVITKADSLAQLGGGAQPPRQDEVAIRAFGDTAIVTGTAHLEDEVEVKWLQQWGRRDGEWKLAAQQGVRIDPNRSTPVGTAGTSAAAVSGGKAERDEVPALKTSDERGVWQSIVRLADTYGKGDVAGYSRLTDDRFARILPNGQLVGRDDWLQTVEKNATPTMRRPVFSNVTIRVHGDSATVASVIESWAADGTPEGRSRLLRVMMKKNGTWQQIASVSTPLSEQ